MNTQVIDPDYQWKEAASQEGVDYDAVQKSFMDQSYGVVANKAKVLFQDPFRLGFEIVHRNEKATKMVGIFAFRVNQDLLYAPTFFVNGEIKAADMLYRADVKRFVPLTEDWCAYLVRGVSESAGDPVDKSRMRQADAYMDRLAYPQRVKYASEIDFEDDEMNKLRDQFAKAAADGSLWREMVTHCADATPLRKLIPEIINEQGPEALEKLAGLLDDSPGAERFLVENYSKEELETVDAWMAKEASPVDPEAGSIVINLDPLMAKSASSREDIFAKGYELVDKRPEGTCCTVVEECGDGTVKQLSGTCAAEVLLEGGKLEKAFLLNQDNRLLSNNAAFIEENHAHDRPECIYYPATKELAELSYNTDVFGDELIDQKSGFDSCDATGLQDGKFYVAVDADNMTVSRHFKVVSKSKDGECTRIKILDKWGDEEEIFYAPDREHTKGNFISDEMHFLEVKCDVERYSGDEDSTIRRLNPTCDKVLMDSSGIDKWMRTAGGITTSNEFTVAANDNGTFDIRHTENGTILKEARDLGMLEAHLKLAEDFTLTVDKAGEILDKAVDRDVSYRAYDDMSKSGYMTRAEGMEDWIQAYDPELQVKLDTPQRQILSTFTPRRPDQVSRYGDTHQRVPAENSDTGEDLLPLDAVLNESPEQLAVMSQQLDMPHIFDHGCLEQMATQSYNIVEQIKQYIPDLEAGVDRYFRILFLLRYRPADFEEAYGKDALIELEQDLAELAARAGENLLRMLQRFDTEQYNSASHGN